MPIRLSRFVSPVLKGEHFVAVRRQVQNLQLRGNCF